jgi:NADH-quinone oxidoreductase subunit A
MLIDYLIILYFSLVCLFVAILLPIFSTFLVKQDFYLEKNTAYECGFQPFEDVLMDFDVKYYLIAIIFLIFDLELMFLIPFVFSLEFLGLLGLLSALIFFFCLIFGFIYEWARGGLEWR